MIYDDEIDNLYPCKVYWIISSEKMRFNHFFVLGSANQSFFI